jgi:hypothetical protein
MCDALIEKKSALSIEFDKSVNKFKETCIEHSEIMSIEYDNKFQKNCFEYFFENYYANLTLFLSDKQQECLFNSLVGKENLFINSVIVPPMNISSTTNRLLVKITMDTTRNVNIFPELNITETSNILLKDIYKINIDGTINDTLNSKNLEQMLRPEDLEKLKLIKADASLTSYDIYINHITELNLLITQINDVI